MHKAGLTEPEFCMQKEKCLLIKNKYFDKY